ncbi:TIGR02611 family protein [Micromonospora yangpuensis]|uniref:TIGR02611 family protein n=1 Tax=Micromonospora yangpuensis TaxID=683228 RepID=A0A1C6UEL4_9ACTN|nr:hypothetical protein GCM10012279_25040 [Micromonospora yangpuensis]SCL52510.1 TIGR02611 family protein [Micromonospora yangpuensis]
MPTDQQGSTGGTRPSGRPADGSRGPGRKPAAASAAASSPAASSGPGGAASAAPSGPGGAASARDARRANGSAPDTVQAAPPTGRLRHLRRRVRTTLDLIRANPTGRITLKITIAIVGALVVTLGIVMIPLPGPGWLVVIAGLGIWAVEFHWAKRLLGFTRRHVQGWTRWATTRPLPLRLALGSIGLLFVATVAWLSLKYSLGIDVVARALHYIATH